MKTVIVLFGLVLLIMVSCNTYTNTDKHVLSPYDKNHNSEGIVLTEVNRRSGEFTENVTRVFK